MTTPDPGWPPPEATPGARAPRGRSRPTTREAPVPHRRPTTARLPGSPAAAGPAPDRSGPAAGRTDPRTWLWVGLAVVAAVVLVQSHKLSEQEVIIFCVLVPSLILHEVAHGVVALACGDDTAQRAGRLSLNPVRHVDPLGTIVVPAITVLAGWGFFGWAKPVPVNLSKLRSPRNQGVLVALAGPGTNVVLAALGAVAFKLTGAADHWPLFANPPVWVLVLFYFGLVNCGSGAFNLIPVPPLDGSVLVERLLPRSLVAGLPAGPPVRAAGAVRGHHRPLVGPRVPDPAPHRPADHMVGQPAGGLTGPAAEAPTANAAQGERGPRGDGGPARRRSARGSRPTASAARR